MHVYIIFNDYGLRIGKVINKPGEMYDFVTIHGFKMIQFHPDWIVTLHGSC